VGERALAVEAQRRAQSAGGEEERVQAALEQGTEEKGPCSAYTALGFEMSRKSLVWGCSFT